MEGSKLQLINSKGPESEAEEGRISKLVGSIGGGMILLVKAAEVVAEAAERAPLPALKSSTDISKTSNPSARALNEARKEVEEAEPEHKGEAELNLHLVELDFTPDEIERLKPRRITGSRVTPADPVVRGHD